MGSIFFSGAHTLVTTDETGVGSLKTKIPGTFSGIDGFSMTPPNGRYMKKIQLWTESGVVGDLITNIRLEDTDQILRGLSVNFPNYPVIQYLCDKDFGEQDLEVGGIGIPPNQGIELVAIDPHDNRGFQFLPAQLYLCADFKSGDRSTGKVLRVNYIWGKYFG